MLRAVWNGIVLAEAPRTVRLEYTITSKHGTLTDAAWYYPHPSPLARRIKDHVAFYGTVTIEGKPEPRSNGRRGLLDRLLRRSEES